MSCLTHLKVDCRGGGVGNFSVLAALTYTGKYNEQYIRLTEGGGGRDGADDGGDLCQVH